MLIFLVNSLHTGKFFLLMLSSAAFFKINLLKNSFSNTIRVLDGLDSDRDRHSVDLIWVQPVCKGYQQMTKAAASQEKVKKRYTGGILCLFSVSHLFLIIFCNN